jgi:hypothetical protein
MIFNILIELIIKKKKIQTGTKYWNVSIKKDDEESYFLILYLNIWIILVIYCITLFLLFIL